MNCELIKCLLDREAARINHPDFIAEDPVQFPRRFSDLRDIEIAAFSAAMMAWGNRKMICRDIDRFLLLTGHDPYHFVMDEGYEEIPDTLNIHRTMFGRNIKHFLRGLRSIYRRYDSLDAFAAAQHIAESETPSWQLVEQMNREIIAANEGMKDNRTLPQNLKTTALKRVNMALRWLVRDDGIVDMGVWKSIDKSQLFIPLDVHVGNIARQLGILERKADDRKSVEMLTATLREMRPEDPVIYDYALFGLGVSGVGVPNPDGLPEL